MPENREQFNPEQEAAPETLYHGTVTGDIGELEPRRRSIPDGANPETQPKLVYASDNAAFAAAHSFHWGSSEGFELSVEKDGVLFRVPEDQKERLNVPVQLYTLSGEHFIRTAGEGTGHSFQTKEPTKPSTKESFSTVQQAIEYFGGKVEYY